MKEQKFLFVFTDEDDKKLNRFLNKGWKITHISASGDRGCYVVIERTKFMNGNENNLPNLTEDKPIVY